ncbi:MULTISPECIES: LrgB family protein [Myroides]|uniref:CidB/LrgB family autolysis modulator n=1 Tax=Myroides albus TaxID=2562892 RepID=A0A6I3LIH0_9FLAO|nr:MULTISPECIES: LrgB family protein [Myroides]MTG97386.1 CidB/LrgB family autolysis modulator [Myroides albus]MVX35118.1 CidB/LrgB family autolysis modulator [Myroides sp. LoEW2-1]UVD79415.1 LrgB family protein [Myroides albus]
MKFLTDPTFLLFLTLAFYSLGIFLTSKKKWIVFNPIILSTTILICYLLILKIPYEKYSIAGHYIDFFLKPSIVALAVPLYLQWDKIKKQLFAILCSQLLGCIVGVVSVVFLAKWTGADKEIILSLAPKSVSTPIALEISNTVNGIPSITAASVMIAGIFGSMIGFKFLNMSRISNPMSQGIAMGTSSHALGTMKAMEISNKYGAFASVGMIFNGILTAFLAPIILTWLDSYL